MIPLASRECESHSVCCISVPDHLSVLCSVFSNENRAKRTVISCSRKGDKLWISSSTRSSRSSTAAGAVVVVVVLNVDIGVEVIVIAAAVVKLVLAVFIVVKVVLVEIVVDSTSCVCK